MGSTFVDGLGVGDVQDVALRDRRHLSEDGVLIVVATVGTQNGAETAAPEVISRGFAETDSLLEEASLEVERTVESASGRTSESSSSFRSTFDNLGKLVADRTGRRPMILLVVVEV